MAFSRGKAEKKGTDFLSLGKIETPEKTVPFQTDPFLLRLQIQSPANSLSAHSGKREGRGHLTGGLGSGRTHELGFGDLSTGRFALLLKGHVLECFSSAATCLQVPVAGAKESLGINKQLWGWSRKPRLVEYQSL